MYICCIEGSYLENLELKRIHSIHQDIRQRYRLQQEEINMIWIYD